MSSGLQWTSYTTLINASQYTPSNASGLYADTIRFFNSSPNVISSGTVTSFQTNGTINTPPITTFTLSGTTYVAVKLAGFFSPNQTGNWTFSVGVSASTERSDDVGILFLGTAGSTITPSSTFSAVSTTLSNTTPIVFNYFWQSPMTYTSSSINLTAGLFYPILLYVSQAFGGYSFGLSFAFNGGTTITNFTGYMYNNPVQTTSATALTAFSSGTYRHVAMTISGSTHTLYLDGAVVATNTNAGNVFSTYSSLSNLYLGTAVDLSFGFTGIIDDFKIWNRALPPTDIISVYTNNTPKLGPIDYLSSTTKTALLNNGTTLSAGAYGVRLLYSKYTGPVLTIRRSSDSISVNFYADTSGNLGTGYNASGTSLATWLSDSLAYVSQWWDQTGNGNHATQTTLAAQPVYNTYYNNIDFSVYNTGANAWLNVPSGAFPYGTTSYSYIFKHGIINNNFYGTFYSGGNTFPSLANSAQMDAFSFSTNGYRDYWWNNDIFTNANVSSNNAVITNKYNGTNRFIYVNGSPQTINVSGTPVGTRNQTSSLNVLGKTPGNNGNSDINFFNSQLFYFYYMPISISDTDRGILENTGIVSYLYPTSVLDYLSTTTKGYMLYSGITYTANSGTTAAFSSTGGDFTASSGGYTYVVCKTSQNITFSGSGSVEYIIIGGGGSGGNDHGGGGGSGGIMSGTVSVTSGTYAIVVGQGGTTAFLNSNNGGNSSAFGITALGGGRGGGNTTGAPTSGGSGGGGGGYNGSNNGSTVVPGNATGSGLGFAGGYGILNGVAGGGGGGGGAGAVGTNAPVGVSNNSLGGTGGSGTNTFSAWLSVVRPSMPSDWKTATTSGYIAAGGGGGSWGASPVAGGTGGGGTGGNATFGTIASPTNAVNFTGSGGGGGGSSGQIGATGGNGLVMFRYVPSTFTVATTNAPTGAYGVRLLYGAYQGPVMTVRRSSDSVSANFYADTSGNVGTRYFGTGTSLTSWLNGATAYVSHWWDQTGNNNTAVQPTTSAQPTYNTTNKCINYPANCYFILPNGTHPFNDSEYTYVTKYNSSTKVECAFFGGGTDTNYNNNNFVINNTAVSFYPGSYFNYWRGYAASQYFSSFTVNTNYVVSLTFSKSSTRTVTIYNNGINLNANGANPSVTRNQPNTPNYIGADIQGRFMNGNMFYMYITPIAISEADRIILEATTT